MLTIDVDEIWFVDRFWPSTNTKPEVVLNDRGRHLEKSIWRHISVIAVDPEWHDNNGDEVKIETE